MAAFSGKYYYSVDPKGRVMIPAPLREVITANYSPVLMVTNAPVDRCINLYPLEEWNNQLEKVRALPKNNKAVKLFMRNVIGSAVEVLMDRQGRLLIPASLRQDSGINGDLVIVGQLDKIEVWDRSLWEKATDLSGVDVDAYEQALSDFGL
jgi:MraZ protein